MSVEGDEWWEGALEEDTTWSLPLEGEGGLWESGFLPPPPRPAFLDDIQPDGLTTCDLCTWARAPEPGPHTLDSSSGNYTILRRKKNSFTIENVKPIENRRRILYLYLGGAIYIFQTEDSLLALRHEVTLIKEVAMRNYFLICI